MRKKEISMIILAGGASSRMGRNAVTSSPKRIYRKGNPLTGAEKQRRSPVDASENYRRRCSPHPRASGRR